MPENGNPTGVPPAASGGQDQTVSPSLEIGSDLIPRVRLNQEIERRKQSDARIAELEAQVSAQTTSASSSTDLDLDDDDWLAQGVKKQMAPVQQELSGLKQTQDQLNQVIPVLVEDAQQRKVERDKATVKSQLESHLKELEAKGIEMPAEVKQLSTQLAENVAAQGLQQFVTMDDIIDKALGAHAKGQIMGRVEEATAQAQAATRQPAINPVAAAEAGSTVPGASNLATDVNEDNPFADIDRTKPGWEREFFAKFGGEKLHHEE